MFLVLLRSMCDHAFGWAKQNGLWQINPVHKEEEASLVIERLFQVAENEGEEMSQTGSFQVEDWGHKDAVKPIYCVHGIMRCSSHIDGFLASC